MAFLLSTDSQLVQILLEWVFCITEVIKWLIRSSLIASLPNETILLFCHVGVRVWQKHFSRKLLREVYPMDPVTSLKIIVFPSLEDKIFVGDKKGFCPASSNVLYKPKKSAVLLDDRQTRNGERTESTMLTEERKSAKNRRQFSCPKIIDFNTLKSFQEIRPMHKPRRIFNGFFPSRVRSTTAALGNTFKEGQVSFFSFYRAPNG